MNCKNSYSIPDTYGCVCKFDNIYHIGGCELFVNANSLIHKFKNKFFKES